MMKTEKVKIPIKTKKNIAAAIHYPEIETDKLAVLCPGNLDTKDYNHLIKLAETLSKEGYTTVRFDPLGTWESDGQDADYSVSRYLKDVASVLDFMLSRKSYKTILLGGHSRGGEISILYAAQDPRISIVVPIMPPTPISAEELKGDKYTNWKKQGFYLSTRDIPGSSETKSFKLPYDHLTDRLKFNSIQAVKKIHTPIIFVAGELDKVCLPEEVKILFDNANEPKRYLFLRGIGHGYRRSVAEIDIVNAEILKTLQIL